MQKPFRLLLLFALGLLALTAVEAWAQPIATLRWQLQPFCNVVTLNVTAQGSSIFAVDGFDDQCGASVRAGVVGTAFLNPDGSIGMGLSTVIAPGGAVVHVDARISLATLTGPWRDSAGNGGTFVPTPGPGAGGAPRPVPANGIPPASITSGQLAPGAVGATAVAPQSLNATHLLDAPRQASAAGPQYVELMDNEPTVMRSVTLTVPTAGTVIVNASGYLQPLGAGRGQCVITTGLFDSGYATDAVLNGLSGLARFPFGLTRAFAVVPGSFTVHLMCMRLAGQLWIGNTSLTAFFISGG